MNFHGKKVLILGAGETGVSMARHLKAQGALLSLADTRADPPGRKALMDGLLEASPMLGALPATLFDGVDVVAVSPGFPVSGPLAAPLVQEARARDIPFVGDIELFALALNAAAKARGYRPKVLAITGTNGKTTVTALAAHLARRAGKRTQAAGNISPAALDAWAAAEASGDWPEVWVLELSSYQLETTSSLEPDVAVVLNLSEDHLDRHGSMDAYAEAKARIFKNSSLQLLNRDDARTWAMKRPWVAKSRKDLPPLTLSFGASEPQGPHEYGLVRELRDGGITWLCEGSTRLAPTDVLRIKGAHNAMNALAALALTRAIGLPLAPLIKGLSDYAGEAHRVQSIAVVNNIEYIDDSKGTNVGATLAALNGLGADLKRGARIVLIAGGDGKGQSFAPLEAAVRAYVRQLVLIGADAARIDAALADAGVPRVMAQSLEEAVNAASNAAQAGDIVLLSPACASLDMFRNYAHRAEVFVTAVRALSNPVQVSEASNANEANIADDVSDTGDESATPKVSHV